MEFLDRITLTYFFVAVAAFVVTQALFNFIARPIVGRMELNRRMKMIMVENSRERVFAELMKARGLTATGSYRYPLVRGFNTLVVFLKLLVVFFVIIIAHYFSILCRICFSFHIFIQLTQVIIQFFQILRPFFFVVLRI